MMRSLYAGVSGLRVHQTQMDVIGNNIANVNTAGFKKSRVTFQEMLNQTLRGASSPQDNRGGTNPTQIGLGVNLGSIDVIHSAGSPQSTGKSLDMAIEGEGFFVVGEGSNYYYTRAGNFDFDFNNNLVNPNGLIVKGWVRNPSDTSLITTGDVVDIDLSDWKDSSIAGSTTEMKIGKNLDSRLENNPTVTSSVAFANSDITGASSSEPYVIELGPVFADSIELEDAGGNTVTINHNDSTFDSTTDDYKFDRVTGRLEIYGNTNNTFDPLTTTLDDTISVNTFDTTSHSTPITVYDQNGVPHDLVIQYRKVANSPNFQWKADVFIKGENSSGVEGYEKVTAASHTIEFDADGKISTGKSLTVQRSFTGGTSVDIDIDFDQLTQLGQETTALALSQNGYEPGSLGGLSVNTSGAIVGTFSNGQNITLAQVAIGTFANPGGLAKYGNTLFKDSKNSGESLIGTAGTAGRGVIKPETLEMSNVDLSREFVDMITTQRGFQANSRIITTSDEMLQELVNLKR